jgi:ubiquinone/menaquinone biosynthesis C-methylase UbiE
MEPTEHNRRAFDELHRRRSRPRAGLPPIVKATLGDLRKKKVLHLQSGGGASAAELAEAGAVVTAIDPDERLLDAAREQWPKILWILGDAQSLPAELRRGRFDLVYSPEGTVWQLDSLDAWAGGVASALHDRGELLVYETHPVALCVDGLQHWHYDYFAEGFWRLGRIVTSLIHAGFRIEALEEYPGERRLPGTFLLYARRV